MSSLFFAFIWFVYIYLRNIPVIERKPTARMPAIQSRLFDLSKSRPRFALGMSVKMQNTAWQCDLEPLRAHLLQAICDCADDEGRAYPSLNYLAWKTGMAKSTVKTYVDEWYESQVLVRLGMRSEIEPHIAGNSDKNTVVILVQLDRLARKKPWRRKYFGVPDNGIPQVGIPPVGMPSAAPGIPSDLFCNKEEPSLEPSLKRGPLEIAKQLMELCGIPDVGTNKKVVKAALISETAYTGQEIEQVARDMAAAIRRDRESGIKINTFYFQDATWRANGNSKQKRTGAIDPRASRERYREGAHHVVE